MVGPPRWVGLAGHAASEAELVRDLYRFAAGRWVEEERGFTSPSYPRCPSWPSRGSASRSRTCRRTGSARARPRIARSGGVVVREGTIGDLRETPELVTEIWVHHTLAPTFTGLTVPPVEEFLADWEETLELPNTTYFVAELDGRVVGHLLLEQEEPDLARPAGSVYLAVAATVPEARGRGVGVALTEQALRWAREAGCSTVHTIRRQPGVVRFWPARGFRETFYRLARRVEIG